MDDDDVLGIVKAGDAFPENGIEPSRKGAGHFPGGGSIVIGAEAGQLLDDAQFLDIPGNGGLGAVEASLPQGIQQLLLSLHIGGGDDFHNLCLSF